MEGGDCTTHSVLHTLRVQLSPPSYLQMTSGDNHLRRNDVGRFSDVDYQHVAVNASDQS